MTRLKDRDAALSESETALSSSALISDSPAEKEIFSTESSSALSQPKPEAAPKQRFKVVRGTGRFIRRHPRFSQTLLVLMIVGGTGLFLLHSLFREAWSSERDHLSVMRTIFDLETAREDALPIDDDLQQVITRSYQDLEPYVAEEGWVWENRFGSTITYAKQDKHLIASCGPYSALYMICNLSEVP